MVSELEITNFKRLELIEKQNNFDITSLYLQEYKKEFAFLTKFHYFYHKKLTNLTFERRKKNFWKFQKKNLKKKLFFQMQNVSFLVTEIMKFC